MLIIGERINSTRSEIQAAIRERNTAHIVKEAKAQFDAGARILDVNCAMGLENELEDIDWVTSVIKNSLPEAGICADSPNWHAIERALRVFKGKGEVFINSITADESRIASILPIALEHNANVIALLMDESGMPETADERVVLAKRIIERVARDGFDPARLYFDPLIRPLSTEPGQAIEVVRSITLLGSLGMKTVCGLSNISYGLPKRKIVNATFLAMAIGAGLDAALIDPTDPKIFASLVSAEAIAGKDLYCKRYLAAFREGKL